jgi:hypothetical protein
MIRDGHYSVWYKAAPGEGLGIVTLQDGRIVGGDTMVRYEGTYRREGDQFWASIKTKRWAPGRLPIFQIDELDISLSGRSNARIPTASGSVQQVPSARFEIILVPIADDDRSAA